jgi:Tfp pilus assembly protein PilF
VIKDVLRAVMPGIVVAAACIVVFSGCSEEKAGEEDVLVAQRRAVAPEVRRLLSKANRAYNQGAFRSALALVDSVLQHDSDLADGHFLRGKILRKLKQFEAAASSFGRVAAIVPTYPSI